MDWDELNPSDLGQGGTNQDGGTGGSGGTAGTGGVGGNTGGFGGSTGGFGGSTGGFGGSTGGFGGSTGGFGGSTGGFGGSTGGFGGSTGGFGGSTGGFGGSTGGFGGSTGGFGGSTGGFGGSTGGFGGSMGGFGGSMGGFGGSTGGFGGSTGGFGGSTGGFGGTGGFAGTGGSAGTGGFAGTGGSAGTGGFAGTGGSGGDAAVCVGNPNDDCDADGWRVSDGDCCDKPGFCSTTPDLVNPGAFEYIGNAVDDDCDGLIDNIQPPCDGLLNNSNSSDPVDYAKALDLCQTTTENAPLASRRWGVINGKFSLTNGTGNPSSKARSIRSLFGDLITPIHGGRIAALSTGNAASVNQTNPDYAMFQPGVDLGLTSQFPPDWYAANGNKLPNAPNCPSPTGNAAHDPIMLTLRIRVPTNAKSFSFASWFFSAEFPEYVCTQFNDFFVVLVDTPTPQWPNPADKNLAVYRVSNPPKLFPIGVNLAADPDAQNLFSVCKAGPTGCSGSPTPGNATCLSGPTYLQGTGFDDTSQQGCGASNMLGGGTGWLTTVGNVAPGQTMEIRIALWDTSDGVWDSLVLLDNWVWNVYPASPGTW